MQDKYDKFGPKLLTNPYRNYNALGDPNFFFGGIRDRCLGHNMVIILT